MMRAGEVLIYKNPSRYLKSSDAETSVGNLSREDFGSDNERMLILDGLTSM
jgi:hypothetical protein